MLRSGQPVTDQWLTVNRHGRQGTFHSGEIISARDAMESRRPRMLIAGGGIQLASPMEYDMTQAYPAMTLVHVGASNNAVTSGTIDPISGQPVTSQPGWYLSGPNGVPIATVDGSPGYNIPQVPLPDADNIDDPVNFWVLYLADPQCY